MKIAIGSDHAGFQRKKEVIGFLTKVGHRVVDLGCYSEDSCDYPDYARKVARAVSLERAERGILICGTGIGMAMAANKFKGVRAAVCWNVKTAALASEHNQANILCLSGRFISTLLGEKMIRAWLKTPFAGGRHQRRIKKIEILETTCKQQK
ncbi:MAG: ribose 5-phosphate isomerase B [Elusimicrobia bacterium RIFCSPLOWO2_02_FULL_39_32]|nr:MAG: ribose 5-phosphate isomerase B [Elusimicrobia bacterium RIFCSPHIGHO2_02_FULL_39_36]OGR93491.1 MAG: ribose 5-phosphate isomerase B [Elusimicrobia bacterium RIFCSPLOWO2_02_FULL_39_32]OGS00838.1 MAG: ribose 5-phosphate isomerase B [Elusimicrobia bacterium RIFCSPLOWO2_12_FULL_39_28]